MNDKLVSYHVRRFPLIKKNNNQIIQLLLLCDISC